MPSYRKFVGREKELAHFRRVLEEPAGQAILMVGQQGMGKTTLADRMLEYAREERKPACPTVRYQVTSLDSADATMELMLQNAYAVTQTDGSFSDDPHRRQQWKALLSVVLPKGKELVELASVLRRNEKKLAREQLLDVLTEISTRFQETHRGLFLLDSEKYMKPGTDEVWTLVVRRLPEKIKFIFAQRPEDVLAASPDFRRLENVVAIPEGGLEQLDESDITELVALGGTDLVHSRDELMGHSVFSGGHPYSVAASIDMLLEGTALEDLSTDPGDIAAEQWGKVVELGSEAERLLSAYAVLEVPVPDTVVLRVADLSPETLRRFLHHRFLSGLLREEDGSVRGLYHSFLGDHIRGDLQPSELQLLHERAAAVFLEDLESTERPDLLAAQRLPEHVQAVQGDDAFATAIVKHSAPTLRTAGFVDEALNLLRRAGEVVEGESATEAEIFNQFGLSYNSRGDFDRAERHYRQGIETYQRLGHVDGVSTTFGNLGLVYYARGELDRAEKCYRKSLEIEERLQRPGVMANAYSNLGLIYRTRGELDQAEEWHQRALVIEERLERPDGLASAFGNLGLVYFARGEFARAEKWLRRSLEIEERLQRPEGMATAYSSLGLVYRANGELEHAEEWLRKSLEIDERLGRLDRMADQYGNLGVVFLMRGELEQAEKMLRKSLEIEERLGRREGMANLLGNLGVVSLERGELDQAEGWLRRSLEIDERLGRREGLAKAYSNLGLIYRTRGKLEQAEKWVRKSLKIDEELGRLEEMANAYGILGTIYRTQGELDQAEECLRKSLELNEQLGRREEMANTYGNLGLVFRDRGGRERACEHWSRALEILRQEGAGASQSALEVTELLRTECESE